MLYSTAHDIRLNSQPFSKKVLYGAVGGDSTARKNFKKRKEHSTLLLYENSSDLPPVDNVTHSDSN